MAAPPGPGLVRGGEWLQCGARVEVIYVFAAPVRRFGRHCGAIDMHIGERRRRFTLEGRALHCMLSIGNIASYPQTVHQSPE